MEVARAREQAWPPQGVSRADGERALAVAARRVAADVEREELRTLGPQLAPGQMLLTRDEVLTPAREPGRCHEVRTACLLTADGRRYLCGTGGPFLAQVLAAVRACDDRYHVVKRCRGSPGRRDADVTVTACQPLSAPIHEQARCSGRRSSPRCQHRCPTGTVTVRIGVPCA